MLTKSGPSKATNGQLFVDAMLTVCEEREQKLIQANNNAAILRGFLIVVIPAILALIMFLSSKDLRVHEENFRLSL